MLRIGGKLSSKIQRWKTNYSAFFSSHHCQIKVVDNPEACRLLSQSLAKVDFTLYFYAYILLLFYHVLCDCNIK